MNKQLTPLTSCFKSGSWLASLILGLSILGSGLTVWNYSQHVFSTGHAYLINSGGIIEAIFPERLTKKINAHQVARVTFKNDLSHASFRAEVISVEKDVVTLKLLLQGPSNLHSGEPCSVTIDATIPFEKTGELR